MSRILLTLILSFFLIGCSNHPTEPIVIQKSSEVTTSSTNEIVPIIIEGFRYLPTNLNVKVGTTVTWKNNDTAPHTVTSLDRVKTLDSDDLAQGDTFSFTFDTPGIYEYFCAIHPNMKATVTVSE